ncbi:MAG: hypothetical protein ACXVCT_04195, partial [Ktedonobacterales bacterium]
SPPCPRIYAHPQLPIGLFSAVRLPALIEDIQRRINAGVGVILSVGVGVLGRNPRMRKSATGYKSTASISPTIPHGR